MLAHGHLPARTPSETPTLSNGQGLVIVCSSRLAFGELLPVRSSAPVPESVHASSSRRVCSRLAPLQMGPAVPAARARHRGRPPRAPQDVHL
eukprot:587210-Pleurochrysis_carterae.AAC.3